MGATHRGRILLALATTILVLAACGDDDGTGDGGGGGVDGARMEGSARLMPPVMGQYEGTRTTFTHGIAKGIGSRVLDLDSMGTFAVILSSIEIGCGLDTAARPDPGVYAIVYVTDMVGSTSPVTVTMINQTSGPRMSKTFDSGTADVLMVREDRLDMTLDVMLDDGAVSSIFGAVNVPRCF